MLRHEAIDLGSKLKGLMPRMTEEQVIEAGKQLLNVAYAAGAEAVEAYANSAEFFVLAEFIALLPVPKRLDPSDRTAQYLAEHRQQQLAHEVEMKRLDAVVGAKSDEELAALRSAVLESLKASRAVREHGKLVTGEERAALLARIRNVRGSTTWKRLIAEHLRTHHREHASTRGLRSSEARSCV